MQWTLPRGALCMYTHTHLETGGRGHWWPSEMGLYLRLNVLFLKRRPPLAGSSEGH